MTARTTPTSSTAGAPLPENEVERLQQLGACHILDSAPEPPFDNLTRLTASLLGTPIALVSLVDSDRQWFKSNYGLDARETPREHAFCRYAILGNDVLCIPDATADERIRENALVTGWPHIRAYAGAPLRLSTGAVVGTLCAMDTKVRTFSDDQLSILRDLAEQVVSLIELRRDAMDHDMMATELRTIFDSVPSLIYFKDGSNNILNLNKAAAAAMKMDVADVVGRHTEEFFPVEAARKFLEDDREVLRTGKPKLAIEEVHQGGQGESLIIQTDKIPLRNRNGKFDRLVAIATDVTALQDAQRQLDETNQRLALAMQGSGQAAWEWNSITGEVFLSDGWFDMFGYDKSDFAPVFDAWSTLVHPDDVLTARAHLEQHLAGQRPLFDTTVRVRSKDGQWRWSHVIGRVVERTPKGEPHRVTGMVIDINAARKMQDELRQKNAELERFVYTASHDLKSPIVTILGFLDYIIKDAEEGNFDDVAGYAQRIERAAHRMRATIDGLLEMSRIGRPTGPVAGVSIREVAEEVAEDFEQPLREAGIDLELRVGPEAIGCARTHLTQAITNLVSNAIKYGSSGANPKIVVESVPNPDQTVEIRVADNGVGVEPKYRAKIFELFERLSSDSDGTGIGLTIVARVADRYGGRIWMSDTPGGGATFHLLLPAAAAEPIPHEGVAS